MNTKIKICTIILFLFSLFCAPCFAQKAGKKEKRKYVLVSTSYGNIKLVLYNETPLHRDNFIKLVKKKFYDDLLFHRVIPNFMIQGGDPESKTAEKGALLGNGNPGYTIPAEFVEGVYHKRGVLAAAREGDDVNPKKESCGSQFYIVQGKVFTNEELDAMIKQRNISITPEQRAIYTTVGGTPWLDGGYTVFGEVLEGMDVVERIASVKRDKNDRPIEDVKMKIKIVKK